MTVFAVEDCDLTAADLAKLAKSGTVVLAKRGKPCVSIHDVSRHEWGSIELADNPRFVAIIEESRRSLREEGGVSSDEVRRQLGIPARSKPKRKKAESRRVS